MKKITPWILFVFFIFFIFYPFFSFREITGGDFPYFYKEQLDEFSFPPLSWITGQRLGVPIISPWIDTYLAAVVVFFVNTLHISWEIVQTLFFFSFAVILSLFSSYYLFRTIFKKNNLLSAFIYTCNTYFLLLIGGGQIGIVLAYSIAPLVLAAFIKLINNAFYQEFNFKFQSASWRTNFKLPIIAGLLFATQVMFDIRIAYITIAAAILYQVSSIKYQVSKKTILNTLYLILYTFVIPIGITILLHASWLLPLLIYKQNPLDSLGAVYSSQESVKFFSFATLSQTLSLLHPNWPENIFGKIYFMRTEFILVPIFAFSSLLFLASKSLNYAKNNAELRKNILFFALLGLIGAFLAKGANEPFGGLYLWLFGHIPGFVMFRDPTKFYLLVALSYSVLIPFSIWKIYEWLSKFTKLPTEYKIFNLQNAFLIFASLYLVLLIHPVLQGKLTGTFQNRTVPKEYIQFKELILSDKTYSRSLWIPYLQRFGIYTQQHPHVSGYQLFTGMSDWEIVQKLQKPSTEKFLQEAAIRYVIVPYDSEGEIFLDDRKYSEKEYKKYIKAMESISYLTKSKQFGKLVVFQVKNPKEHFWLNNSEASVSVISDRPTRYILQLSKVKKGDQLIFSETYNPYWQARINSIKHQASSIKYDGRFNSFVLSGDGDYQITISYLPQQLVFVGSIVQVTTFVCIGIFFIFFRKKF